MVIDLTRELLRFDTRNPPGDERTCAAALGARLETGGFSVERFEYSEGRTSLIARIGGNADRLPLCFTGHLDVVPVGNTPWQRDPFAGDFDGDRIHGRGASDMKSGVAAMVIAALASARRLPGSPGLALVLTAGEETGCEGAMDLARRGVLGRAGAIVVGEPTSNAAFIGHKGCLRFRCMMKGVTAHSSMPELGDNAIYKAARVIGALERFEFGVPEHPVMGRPTLVVSQMLGGMNINSVPDYAEIAVDVRTVPDQDLAELRARLQSAVGPDTRIESIIEVPSIFSGADDDWIQSVFARVREIANVTPDIRTAPYFTDGAVLRPAYGEPPTVILGPGEATMAHQTDEYCLASRVSEAAAIYERLIDDWILAAPR
jgi:succinyl-diaminopimelate desuccinylase